MKKYRTTVTRLNVRKQPGATSPAIDTLPKGTEFYSAEETATTGGQLWAKRNTGGWVCIHDRLTRYCEELPLPAPAPEEQPAPEKSIEERLRALEDWARAKGYEG